MTGRTLSLATNPLPSRPVKSLRIHLQNHPVLFRAQLDSQPGSQAETHLLNSVCALEHVEETQVPEREGNREVPGAVYLLLLGYLRLEAGPPDRM